MLEDTDDTNKIIAIFNYVSQNYDTICDIVPIYEILNNNSMISKFVDLGYDFDSACILTISFIIYMYYELMNNELMNNDNECSLCDYNNQCLLCKNNMDPLD
jgi:hypothetical protein